MTFILMMMLNLVTNLAIAIATAAIRKFSKRKKGLKQGNELYQRRQMSLAGRKKEKKKKTTKRNYRLYKQLIVIK